MRTKKVVIEMQEDTESFNENSSSEVIILPQNSHIDETLISDDEDTERETPHSYDAKLNAKLKDLGLYEDGMTIQQKEELLAVIAVSFKTAEEEKSKRRWYEEYANAALAFPDDEIEFSFQQSPESELSTKASCYSGELQSTSTKSKGNLNSKSEISSSVAVPSDNSNPSEYQNLPSTSQNSSFKSKSQPRKNRSREGGVSYKLSLEEGNTVTSHSSLAILNFKDAQLTSNRQKKRYLEKSMSRWRPCLSPKDEPLICSSRQMPEESVEPSLQQETNSNQRMLEYMQDFSFALTEIKKSNTNQSHFGKPYHLTRSGHCLRKATKLDSLDIMIGVQEGRNEATLDADTSSYQTVKKESFSRTSGGAFRYAQLHRDRIDALRNNSTAINSHNSCVTTRSGARYNFTKSVEECRTPPEIVIDGIETADIPLPDKLDSNSPSTSQHRIKSKERDCESDVKNASGAKLPKFSNLRPDLCRDSLSSEKQVLSRHMSLPFTGCSTMNCIEENSKSLSTSFRKENHVDSFCQDGELSDSSSVIDVETIVDDEIEEFVLKRKLLQEPSVSDKQTYSNRPKRLKKNI